MKIHWKLLVIAVLLINFADFAAGIVGWFVLGESARDPAVYMPMVTIVDSTSTVIVATVVGYRAETLRWIHVLLLAAILWVIDLAILLPKLIAIPHVGVWLPSLGSWLIVSAKTGAFLAIGGGISELLVKFKQRSIAGA